MERTSLDPKDLENKPVLDRTGRLLGRVRRIDFDPDHPDRGVDGFDVEVDEGTRAHYAEVGPYVELIPDEVTRVGVGEVVVSSDLEEILGRAADRATGHLGDRRPAGPAEGPGADVGQAQRLDLGPDAPDTVDVELLGEPAEDPEWGDDDWEPDWD